MKRWVGLTAVSFFALLFATVGCGSSEVEPETVPEISGPAFVLFYTDN